MRSIDPLVTLPYWNWETNPVTDYPIISDDINGQTGTLGQAEGRLGWPFDTLDSQNQTDPLGYFEDTGVCDVNQFNGADPSCNPAKPPFELDRHVKFQQSPLDFGIHPDSEIMAMPTFEEMEEHLEHNAHGAAHAYLCDHGEVSRSRSPMDPMFWLLHSNCDRVWAAWQWLDATNRMNTPTTVYGSYDDLKLILAHPADSDPSIRGGVSSATSFHRAQLVWRHEYNEAVEHEINVSIGPFSFGENVGPSGAGVRVRTCLPTALTARSSRSGSRPLAPSWSCGRRRQPSRNGSGPRPTRRAPKGL